MQWPKPHRENALAAVPAWNSSKQKACFFEVTEGALWPWKANSLQTKAKVEASSDQEERKHLDLCRNGKRLKKKRTNGPPLLVRSKTIDSDLPESARPFERKLAG